MPYIIIVLSSFYLGYLIWEKRYQQKIRKSFKHIIHVNGTRGKSTTTRLITAGLKNCGYQVFGKTTGTIPIMINTNNEQVEIKRLGLANIREQHKVMRKAYRERAEILVIECMAVSPEMQLLSQEKILQADINIITNVYHDHLKEMGNTLDEIAQALANTIPKSGHLIVSDNSFNHIFEQKIGNSDTLIHVAKEYQGADLLDTFKSNIELALEVARILEVNLDDYFEGMKNYLHDPAAFGIFKLNDTIFLNGFSINDPDSIKINYELICQKYNAAEITILLNVRDDRPTRTIQHVEMLKTMNFKKLIITGTNQSFIKRKFKSTNIVIEKYLGINKLENEKIVFGIGNYANGGKDILTYFEEKGERIYG